MPLLDPEYFSNWYILTIGDKPRILQNYNESQQYDANNLKLLQADIGNHLISISPQYFQIDITSPILIMEAATPSDKLYDVLDVLMEYLQKIQEPLTTASVSSFSYVAESANIQLGVDSSSVNMTLQSWQRVGTGISYAPENYNFIARQAKFYDVQFNMFGGDYLINQATLNFSFQNNKSFYVPGYNGIGNTVPLYSINGYTVTGNVDLLVAPCQYDTLRLYNSQSPGIFNAVRQSLSLKILDRTGGVESDRTINLGEFMFLPNVALSISPNNIISAKVQFATMFRRTSEISF